VEEVVGRKDIKAGCKAKCKGHSKHKQTIKPTHHISRMACTKESRVKATKREVTTKKCIGRRMEAKAVGEVGVQQLRRSERIARRVQSQCRRSEKKEILSQQIETFEGWFEEESKKLENKYKKSEIDIEAYVERHASLHSVAQNDLEKLKKLFKDIYM